MADYGTNTRSIVLATLLGAVLTVVIILALAVLFYWYQDKLETSKRIAEQPAKLEALRETQNAWLTDYRLMDPEKRIVSIPIDRAMGLVVAELSAREQSSSERTGIPEEGIPEEGISEEGISEEGISEEGISEEGIPEEGISEEGISEEGISEDGVKEEGDEL